MRKFLIPMAALVLIGGFLIWFFSPKQVVKRRTEKLMSTLTMEAGSGDASRQFSSLTLGKLIGNEVELEVPSIEEANGVHSKDEINSGFSALARMSKFTKFEIVDWHSIQVEKEKATVTVSLNAAVALPTYQPLSGLYEAKLHWEKTKDEWLLYRVLWQESRK